MAWFQRCVIVVLTLCTMVQGQTATEASCCAANLMDSAGKVVIDVGQAVTGTFVAMKVILCTTTETNVMLWEEDPDDSTMYHLRFQHAVTPNYFGEATIPFDSPMTLNQNWSVGFFSPKGDKHGVPYLFGILVYNTMVSYTSYDTNHVFALGESVVMDPLVYRRSFLNSVFFCLTQDCSDVVALNPVILVGPPGPPGPPGEQGPSGSTGECCDMGFGPSLDALEGVNNKMEENRQETANLYNIVQEMASKINDLTNGNTVTGICPVGFIPGTFGVGACYYVFREQFISFGEAQLTCRSKFPGTAASLVDIRSDIEEQFIRNQITQLIGQSGDGFEYFWTSGMYSSKASQWVWFDQVNRIENTFLYEHFISELDRDTINQSKRCLRLVVDPVTNTSWWSADYCESRHYFICKVLKECL